MKGTNISNETMDRTLPIEPVGSNSGFRVVEIQQRVKRLDKPPSSKHDPLDHGVDNPDKSSSSSSEDDSDDDEEPLITNNTQIHINTGSSVKTAPDPSAKKPETTAANKKQFIRVKLNNKWSKDRWEITDKVPNEGDGIRHAASGKDINVVRRVELKHEIGKNSTPKSPELVNKAPEFGPPMKPSTISLITILDGFAKVKEQNHGQIDVDGAKSKSPAGEPREAPEKVISKVASPVKELEEKAKDENQVPRNQLREAPQPTSSTASENYEPRPKPDKKIFDQKRTVPVAAPVRVESDEPVRSNETICKITEFFDYGKKIMLTMIEEESKSKDQLINDLINELNSLKEANGLALSLMTPEQREKYDKEQAKRSRTRRVLREEPHKRATPSDHRQNPRLNGHPQNQIVQQVTSENKHQQKTTTQKTKGNSNKTPLSAPNGNNATQLQHRGYNGLPPAQQGELPQTSTHAHMAPDPNQQYTPVTVNPANYVRNNLGQYQYIHPHHTVPVQRPNPPQQGQPNNHYHQQNNGLHGLHVNFSSMSSSPHLWNGPTK